MADLERGARVKALRKAKAERLGQKVTQPQMAEAVGVTLRAAQAWEAGGGIDDDHLPALIAFLETDADYLLRGRRTGDPVQRPLLHVHDGDGQTFDYELSQLDRVEKQVNRIVSALETAGVLEAVTVADPTRERSTGTADARPHAKATRRAAGQEPS